MTETQQIEPTPNAARTRVASFLQKRLPTLGEWAKGKLDPASLVRFAMVEWTQSVQLQACTMESIYLALVACAQVGLEPSGIKQEAFIVPFKGVATFMPGWRGLIKLARRSGEVRSIRAHLVYSNDVFQPYLGSDERVVHEPALRDRGELIGAYALAKLANGEIEVEWMPMDELEKIRANAKRGTYESPGYRDWAEQMYRKAPIRRLCKRLPLGEDYFRAAHLDEVGETGDLKHYGQVIDVEAPDLVAFDAPAPVEQPSAPGAPEPAPAPRGIAAAKQQLAQRATARKRAEPAPAEGDVGDLDQEIADIKSSLERVLSNPQWMPGLKSRIARLPSGAERVQLQTLAIEAEQELAAARRQDDMPAGM
jgi:recombination protein RecT